METRVFDCETVCSSSPFFLGTLRLSPFITHIIIIRRLFGAARSVGLPRTCACGCGAAAALLPVGPGEYHEQATSATHKGSAGERSPTPEARPSAASSHGESVLCRGSTERARALALAHTCRVYWARTSGRALLDTHMCTNTQKRRPGIRILVTRLLLRLRVGQRTDRPQCHCTVCGSA